MPEVSLSRHLPASQERSWAVISDPSRFEEWNLLHSKWVEGPPAVLEKGSTMVETITIKGVPDTISFTADEVEAPRLVRLSGTGKVGSSVELTLRVEPRDDGTSEASLHLEFSSSLLYGPVGKLMERAFRTKLVESLDKLAALTEAG